MSKHTPGEWQAINWTYHSTSTVVVDDPSVVTGKRVIAECATEEDARLIATAPRMLVALKRAAHILAEIDQSTAPAVLSLRSAIVECIKHADPEHYGGQS